MIASLFTRSKGEHINLSGESFCLLTEMCIGQFTGWLQILDAKRAMLNNCWAQDAFHRVECR